MYGLLPVRECATVQRLWTVSGYCVLCHLLDYELIVRAGKRTASLAVILEMKLGFMNTGPTCY